MASSDTTGSPDDIFRELTPEHSWDFSISSSLNKPLSLLEPHGHAPSHPADAHTGQRNNGYYDPEELQRLDDRDAVLKHRIRRLRVISRTVALLLSIAALIPVSLTLHKFIQTRNLYKDVKQPDGTVVHRNPWHSGPKPWPTYMYTTVAAASVLFNGAVLIGYLRDVRTANVANRAALTLSWLIILANLGLWIAAAAVYRQQRNERGIPNDLWGWTCATGAQAIQKAFQDDINFNRQCGMQSASWIVGLAQGGAAILSIIVYIYVLTRRKSKQRMKEAVRRAY